LVASLSESLWHRNRVLAQAALNILRQAAGLVPLPSDDLD
jgi:hypothetical protein